MRSPAGLAPASADPSPPIDPTRTEIDQVAPVSSFPVAPVENGARTTLFEVAFAAAMSDGDLATLYGALDLSANLTSVPSWSEGGPAVGLARIGDLSGLYLKPGDAEGHWLLGAVTWGHPPHQAVHRWHVMAAGAARSLDPTVLPPIRLEDDAPAIPDRVVGRVENGRLTHFRRRLVGLS